MSKLSDLDEERWQYNWTKFRDRCYDLHENLNYPPLCLAHHYDVAKKYNDAIQKIWHEGWLLPKIAFITGDKKMFKKFEKTFHKEISEGERFRKATNNNIDLALDLYAKETGERLYSENYTFQDRWVLL